ncbi:hypothetical protein SETIT_7G267700v2 [Setaria italica]|uniref:Uncharacterized protein n=2 Tax=Setaria TaxID=4554 RepID=A0A368S049_SETIT|nr:hypothetical protein SETIT_7G267700v2 [Setaria italica]TKW07005.1 hypothetical protein SEVIR_7G278900v2 [Setaria viridis]
MTDEGLFHLKIVEWSTSRVVEWSTSRRRAAVDAHSTPCPQLLLWVIIVSV